MPITSGVFPEIDFVSTGFFDFLIALIDPYNGSRQAWLLWKIVVFNDKVNL